MSLEVAYVGSKGTHGFAGNGPNYDINPAAVGDGTTVTKAFIIGPDGKPNPTTPARWVLHPIRPDDSRTCGADVGVVQRLRLRRTNAGHSTRGIPFDLGNYYGNDAASTYNAFEVKLDKRFANGLQFLSHYTYSKAYGYPQDQLLRGKPSRYSWGPSTSIATKCWVFSPIYELPFGRGKKYKGDASRSMDYVIGGGRSAIPPIGAAVCRGRQASASAAAIIDDSVPAGPNATRETCTGVGPLDPVAPYADVLSRRLPHLLSIPNSFPVGTDACGSARPDGSGPFALPNCGSIGDVGRNTYDGPRGFYSDLSVSKVLRYHRAVPGEVRYECLQHLQSSGVRLQREQRS